MAAIRIPVYRPAVGARERELVLDCLDGGWISSRGRHVAEFERQFAARTQAGHATAVCNGTVALHLAMLALGIGPGDEVIVPTLTYVASANAIRYVGATPVFADADPATWQIDPDDVARRITGRTRAILAVHLYGQACDMQRLVAIADRSGSLLIEDCAEAFGTLVRGRHVGTFGQVGTYSFYGNKTITTGEGGMVVTGDPALHDRMVRLKGQGLAAGREYWHDIVGYNYRMTNLCAAIGLAQLEQADHFLTRKRAIARRYAEGLGGTGLVMQAEDDASLHSWWMCSVLVPEAAARDPLRAHLAAAGIETRPLFAPVHAMPMYRRSGERFPVAEDLSARGVNLPSWPGLTDGEIDEVIERCAGFAAGWREPAGRLAPAV